MIDRNMVKKHIREMGMKLNSNLLITFRNINRDIDLFLGLKNFVIDVHSGEDTQKIIDDISDVCENNNKTLASVYSELFSRNPNEGLKQMGRYIALTKQLDKIDLSPIEAFLKNDAAGTFVKENISGFIDDVFPAICENDLFNEFRDIGMTFKVHSLDSPHFGEEFINIIFKNESIYTPIDAESINHLIDNYYKDYRKADIVMRDLGQSLKYFETILTDHLDSNNYLIACSQ